jgi:hypothetical protein
MLCQRHHWTWKDVQWCRWLVTPTGNWRPITAGTIELKQIAGNPITRYRYRAGNIPSPWFPNQPNGRNRGEPVASRGARRVRRAAREMDQGQSSHRARADSANPGAVVSLSVRASLLSCTGLPFFRGNGSHDACRRPAAAERALSGRAGGMTVTGPAFKPRVKYDDEVMEPTGLVRTDP